MEKGRNLLRRIVPIAIGVIVLWGLASLLDASSSAEQARRPDVIRINAVARLKPLEMPPAVFLHDKHGKALAAEGKDCTVCHENVRPGRPFTFRAVGGIDDAGRLERAFHENCIGCHADLAKADRPTGPQDGQCRLCHVANDAVVADRVPVRMGDRSLHYLHVSSKAIVYQGDMPNPDGENCGACHHVYDPQQKKLVWKKGAEDACAACHGKTADGSKPSLKTAMHSTCVVCHVAVGEKHAAADGKALPAPAGEKAPLGPATPPARPDGHGADVRLQRIAFTPDERPLIVPAALKLAPGQIPGPGMLPDDPPTRPLPPPPPPAASDRAPQAFPPAAPSPEAAAPGSVPPANVEHPLSPPEGPAAARANARALAEKLEAMIREGAEREAAQRREAARQAAAIEAEIVTGPDTCAGCHTASAQAAYHKVTDPPRLMRGQPDVTLLVPPSLPDGESKRPLRQDAEAGINPVLFNHKAHEAVTDSCRTCHHARISACTDCHTVEGTKEGKFVTLGDAMHESCVGCHQERIMRQTQCAGCHGPLNKPMQITSACAVCHQPLTGAAASGAASPLEKERLESVAENELASRMLKDLTGSGRKSEEAAEVIERMPETVIIGGLSNEYAPAAFPHRRIFRALQEGIGDSGLAAAFHTDPRATCAACHHHSPVEGLADPPGCASCHGSQADKMAVDANRPSLKAAYHQQCMACHDRMQIANPAATDCTGCHAAKPVADAR